jgi:antitoxin PrlF
MMPTVSRKYQITLPRELRSKLQLNAGDEVIFIEEDGKFYIKKFKDLADEVLDSFKDLNETERDFRKGFTIKH